MKSKDALYLLKEIVGEKYYQEILKQLSGTPCSGGDNLVFTIGVAITSIPVISKIFLTWGL